MNIFTQTIRTAAMLHLPFVCQLAIISLTAPPTFAQQDPATVGLNTPHGSDGTRTIIVEAHGPLPEPPVFFTATSQANAQIGAESIEQVIRLTVKVIQGNARTLSLGLNGDGEVSQVQGENLKSWSVRQQDSQRFLDLQVNERTTELKLEIILRTAQRQLPTRLELMHLTPGDAVGFESMVNINDAPGVQSSLLAVEGFAPLSSADGVHRFQSATGGQIQLTVSRDGASPAAIELVDTTLRGDMQANGNSIGFQLRGTARVTEPNSEITILTGKAAVSRIPTDASFRLRLAMENESPVYKLVFADAGTFPVTLDFVAPLGPANDNARSIDFSIAASAVIPLTLHGLAADLEFHRDQTSVVPLRVADAWRGFLPATGRVKLQWKGARQVGEGKLFFTTVGYIEAKVDAGLLRQEHQINYLVLQGELKSVGLLLHGPGEILDVQGSNIVGWQVSEQGVERQLNVTLSQAMSGESQIKVRSQTPLDALPVRVAGLRLSPLGAIRHSGYLRLSNLGSVRLEPTGLSGLTQLSPDQFPGESIAARQAFVYRFPAAEYAFTVVADRIQPEVNISQVVLYELTESDRVIRADIELDVREAPIREWNFEIPADYSVVSVSGASVADTMVASEFTDGRRNLKVIFAQDVTGRQLVSLHLEKSEAAAGEDWVLPRISYPTAKSVRGDIGIMAAPGFRIAVGDTDLLVEKPLSYFPKPSANLQQAFRIREPSWSATMHIEQLERSIQADVFHLVSLSEETAYGSALINYFVTGSPVSEWKIFAPATLGNLMIDGQDVRTWHREGDTLIVALHQPVMGAYTLLVTFQEKPEKNSGEFQVGQIVPLQVQGERGYVQVVSSMQVELDTVSVSPDILKLDPLELPAEFRLLSTSPPLATWQYTARPFDLNLKVNWFHPGTTVAQIVEFSEANSRVSQDGELVTDVIYYVKSRGERTLKIQLPAEPVRLWAVSVNGQPVTARQANEATLIPLPGSTDPNIPIEVSLRLGKPAIDESYPQLSLPIVFAPVLKTQWNVVGDEKHVLVPSGGTVTPPIPVLRPSGLDWLAKHGIVFLLLIGLLTGIGSWGIRQSNLWSAVGLLSLAVAIGMSLSVAATALSQIGPPAALQLNLPILSAGEAVELQVNNMPLWRVNLSWIGLPILVVGLVATGGSFVTHYPWLRLWVRGGGLSLVALGVLLQGDGAPLFFALLALAILLLLFSPAAFHGLRRLASGVHGSAKDRDQTKATDGIDPKGGLGPATSALVLLTMMFASTESTLAEVPDGFAAADAIHQQWRVSHADARLTASGTITVSGFPGDQFVLVRAPAVLTRFEGEGLRLTKQQIPGTGSGEELTYIISIPATEQTSQTTARESTDNSADDAADDAVDDPAENSMNNSVSGSRRSVNNAVSYEASFEYQLQAVSPTGGIPVLTGTAAVQEISLSYDEVGWDVTSPNAASIEAIESAHETQAKVLLGPGRASLFLKPQARDITTEETKFFVETSNLYVPGPGVVDGRHQLHIRTSQGRVRKLNVVIPQGLTVSAVSGPVDSWQFDADMSRLVLEIETTSGPTFDVMIETQRSLDPLPTDVKLTPLTVADASGEIGLLAIAFGPDAQPEKLDSQRLSAVNLGDFDAGLITNNQAVLHRVYRYGADGGELNVRVAAVDPEVRVDSQQVLSLGDERIVLGVNFAVEISRAGLFQLSFPLPSGFEVESLTGAALHHWAELTEGDQRIIILHLNGKTIGAHDFSLTLTSAAATVLGDWEIPRFDLQAASRQTGELVVRPTTGIRLRTVSRQNVSETDPRSLGGAAQGALAFRLLQRDWKLVLGIEQLDPWVTGQVLHEVNLREGQTRTALHASFMVRNASIRGLQIALPITDEDEIRTLRASGDTVSDFVRTASDANIWEVQFKRRVVGNVQFRIEYERRGDRANENETLKPAEFPQAREMTYYLGVRAGGRLELEPASLSGPWQRVDWGSVPAALREAENRSAPTFTFRAVAPASPVVISATRHSLADALKLRVAQGVLTTVLSPTGDQLTAVEATIEVIQRGSLRVTLPDEGELFSIFVNGESVTSIRLGANTNTWQFNILPGIDDRTAQVRFVYSVRGKRLSSLKLSSPQLNVPLENIQWNVIAPQGFELIDSDGNLELVHQANQETYDRDSYLSKISGKRQVQAQQAAQLLEQANQLLQSGEQTKARWALNSVANQYALDAASNEDARVQLENLQTQQAIVGLNTRRQRLYLDNNRNTATSPDNQQFREAAADNPILQQDQLNFRPQQLSQLLRGNTTEDNVILGQIAARLVQHQRATEPAPQAILISLPEEGAVYTFSRTVQVAEDQPLELELEFGSQFRVRPWQTTVVLSLLAVLVVSLVLVPVRPQRVP